MTSRKPVIAYIGLGSNLGDRQATLESAVEQIDRLEGVRVKRKSSWYENPAAGIVGGYDFLNGAISVETTLEPHDLLNRLHKIEERHGRVRADSDRSGRYENRTLDLDLLMYGDCKIDDESLTVPHPRMLERDFVLIPLRELEAELPPPSR